jgi:hypothetical protein
MFSDETDAVVIFRGMSLPSALYPDDPSLQAWTSDPNAERQAIDHSPEVGGGEKEFIVTELRLNTDAPETKANITFILKPSIDYYEGNQVIFHLHGFDCPKGHTPLIGPNADKFGYHRSGMASRSSSWTWRRWSSSRTQRLRRWRSRSVPIA